MAQRVVWLWGRRVFLFALLVTLLSGCGLSFGPTGEPVTLRFLYIKNAADYAPLAEEFTRQHPNITIELDTVDFSYDVGRTLAMKADKADAVRVSATMLPEDMLADFLPIDLQISAAQNFPQDDLFPGSLEGLKLNGKQVGLPAGINPFVVYYSPQKFAAAGIQPPSSNWTLDEFVKAAMAINNSADAMIGTDKYTFGFCSHPGFNDGILFTYLFGGGLFDSLTVVSRPMLDQRANVEALDWYARLKTDMKVIPDRDNPRQVGDLVARSNCGFWIDWLDHSTYGHNTPDDALPLPLPVYNKPFNIAVEDGYFIFAKTEHPGEAWQWISFLMEQQSASGNLIPPLSSQIDAQAYTARVSKGTLAVARSLSSQTVVLGLEMYRNQRFGKVVGLFSQAATQIFKGEKDAKTALDEAQRQAEEAFK